MSSTARDPFPRDLPPPPPDPRDGQRPLEFFDVIAPVERELLWAGKTRTLLFHLLTADEEQDVRSRLTRMDAEHRELGAAICRIAYALLRVDGRSVAEHFPGLQERLEWVGTWPSSLIKGVIDQYEAALIQPLLALNDFLADPNSGPAPSTSGAWWSGGAS